MDWKFQIDDSLKDGYTALHLAVEYGKPQVVQMLLGYGAQVEFKGGKVCVFLTIYSSLTSTYFTFEKKMVSCNVSLIFQGRWNPPPYCSEN